MLPLLGASCQLGSQTTRALKPLGLWLLVMRSVTQALRNWKFETNICICFLIPKNVINVWFLLQNMLFFFFLHKHNKRVQILHFLFLDQSSCSAQSQPWAERNRVATRLGINRPPETAWCSDFGTHTRRGQEELICLWKVVFDRVWMYTAYFAFVSFNLSLRLCIYLHLL